MEPSTGLPQICKVLLQSLASHPYFSFSKMYFFYTEFELDTQRSKIKLKLRKFQKELILYTGLLYLVKHSRSPIKPNNCK